MRSLLFAILIALALPGLAYAAEPPSLAEAVASGTLPPLEERLPTEPRLDVPQRDDWASGTYGGTLRLLTRGGRDARDLSLLGYARLLVWNADYELVPDILAAVEVEEGRRFTLRLRKGHRWSDGAPFTAEDFRFWWERVANDERVNPAGLPAELLVEGKPPSFEVLSETALRYSWEKPNNRFLPALAAAGPLYIYRPAHYLGRFHIDSAEPDALAARLAEADARDWAQFFLRKDRPFEMDNVEMPTLEPWVNTSSPPAERYVARRNPYFHRIDGEGRQLPYIDEVTLTRAQGELIPLKVQAGEADLVARGLSFADVAFLKQAETGGKFRLLLWPIGRGTQLALYPNLNAADPIWRKLMRDVRVRRALSLGIDREEIVQAIYAGLAEGRANTLLPESPLFREENASAWARHDPEAANALLDEAGLDRRNEAGLRLLPGRRAFQVVIESGETDPAEVDILQLVAAHWRALGIEALLRTTGRQNFRNRVQSGEAALSIFYGLANGLARADMDPGELAPTSDRQNNWPAWGLHWETGGARGEAPKTDEAKALLRLYEAWSVAPDEAQKAAAWRALLNLHSEEVFTIGLIGRVRQPIAISPRLRNLPEEAPYLYEPGAYLGIQRADTFWFAE